MQAWFVAGVFVCLAVPLTLWDIAQHLRHWNNPHLQKHIVRILLMVRAAAPAFGGLRYPCASHLFENRSRDPDSLSDYCPNCRSQSMPSTPGSRYVSQALTSTSTQCVRSRMHGCLLLSTLRLPTDLVMTFPSPQVNATRQAGIVMKQPPPPWRVSRSFSFTVFYSCPLLSSVSHCRPTSSTTFSYTC